MIKIKESTGRVSSAMLYMLLGFSFVSSSFAGAMPDQVDRLKAQLRCEVDETVT